MVFVYESGFRLLKYCMLRMLYMKKMDYKGPMPCKLGLCTFLSCVRHLNQFLKYFENDHRYIGMLKVHIACWSLWFTSMHCGFFLLCFLSFMWVSLSISFDTADALSVCQSSVSSRWLTPLLTLPLSGLILKLLQNH